MKPTEFLITCYNNDILIHHVYGEVSIRLGPVFNGDCAFYVMNTGKIVQGNIKDLVFSDLNIYNFVPRNNLITQEHVDLIINMIDDNYIYDVGLLDHFNIEINRNKQLKKRFD